MFTTQNLEQEATRKTLFTLGYYITSYASVLSHVSGSDHACITHPYHQQFSKTCG